MKTKFTITIFLLSIQLLFSKNWQIGPSRTYTACHQIMNLVSNGDTVEIDYAKYSNVTQTTWNKNNLYITGVGARPTLEAGSTILNDMSNGKGIFVVSGSNVKINNIEFTNAKVQSHNGAGIRQEGANLHITNCKFDGNEMGILAGNISNCKTTIEFCEFLNGGSTADPGFQHNIYINHIDSFIFRYNYTHDALAQGHELKSRANYNFILYNRISNVNNIDSRNIDIPNGGTTVIIGNVIEQGQNSANSNILGYGLEGLSNASPHQLWVCNNTFINKKSTGSFIHIANNTDTFFVKNNIFAGAKTGGLFIGTANTIDSSNNILENTISNLGFADVNNFNYKLTSNSIAVNKGVIINKKIKGYELNPKYSYKDTCKYEIRTSQGSIDIGAYEFFNPINLISSVHLKDILIYPNPANDFIYFNNVYYFYLYDNFGKIIDKGYNNYIDISNLLNGTYYVSFENIKYKVIKLQ